MGNDAKFATDLYHGSAACYDRYRLAYPDAMIADILRRTAPSGQGRLLGLACGTGKFAFPLAGSFAEVWAVDQEPDMIDLVQAKASALGPAMAPRFRPVVSGAEQLDLPPAAFELVVIGNAFRRLDREAVAGRVRRWLIHGGHLALCWSFMPWNGTREWQRAFGQLVTRWAAALGGNRIPARTGQAPRELPDAELLFEYGFEMIGHYEFAVEHHWTIPDLAGLIRSTAFLPDRVLGDHGAAFDAELSETLGPYTTNSVLTETVQFAYELARRP